MSQVSTRTFVCSECGGEVGLSDQGSDALLQSGCPLCTSPVEQEDID
jgi:DNA-directed RNA polymerase subunit RPC12/RpoP